MPGIPLYPKDQGTEWMNLKQQVKNAFTSANARVPYQKIAASIVRIASSLEILAGAFLKFTYENNTDGIYIGSGISFSGEPHEGMYIRRNTGETMFTALTAIDDGAGFTGVWDKSGNIVLSDDAVSGQGLGRPYIPYTFGVTAELTTPPANRQNSTTSDLAIYSTIAPIQHPKMSFWAYVYIQTGGSTAEVKVKDITTGATLYTSGGVGGGWLNANFPISYSFGEQHQLDITIRRASGSNNVGLTLGEVFGVQS
jgi:hypothetical protein